MNIYFLFRQAPPVAVSSGSQIWFLDLNLIVKYRFNSIIKIQLYGAYLIITEIWFSYSNLDLILELEIQFSNSNSILTSILIVGSEYHFAPS